MFSKSKIYDRSAKIKISTVLRCLLCSYLRSHIIKLMDTTYIFFLSIQAAPGPFKDKSIERNKTTYESPSTNST